MMICLRKMQTATRWLILLISANVPMTCYGPNSRTSAHKKSRPTRTAYGKKYLNQACLGLLAHRDITCNRKNQKSLLVIKKRHPKFFVIIFHNQTPVQFFIIINLDSILPDSPPISKKNYPLLPLNVYVSSTYAAKIHNFFPAQIST